MGSGEDVLNVRWAELCRQTVGAGCATAFATRPAALALAGIPELDATCGRRVSSEFSGRGSEYLSDERGLVPGQEHSMCGRVATNAVANSGYGALPTITSSATRCRITAASSFGL